jgi:hypothetical protein
MSALAAACDPLALAVAAMWHEHAHQADPEPARD